MSKFTNFKWKILRLPNKWEILPTIGSGYITIAVIPGDEYSNFSQEEKEANVRLIAAAPEMYDLLKYAQKSCNSDTGLYERINEILTRIDGEYKMPEYSELKPCPFCGGEATSYFIEPAYARAYCTKCHSMTRDYSTEQEMREVWNRRISE